MRVAALPDKIRGKQFHSSRSPLNWRVTLNINYGVFLKNFYALSEQRAEDKARRWVAKHYDEDGYCKPPPPDYTAGGPIGELPGVASVNTGTPFFFHQIDGELVPCAPRPRVLQILKQEEEAAGEPDGWAEELVGIIFKEDPQ